MDAVWAEEELRAFTPKTAEQVKALTLMATGDKRAAEHAWAKHLDAQMRAQAAR